MNACNHANEVRLHYTLAALTSDSNFSRSAVKYTDGQRMKRFTLKSIVALDASQTAERYQGNRELSSIDTSSKNADFAIRLTICIGSAMGDPHHAFYHSPLYP